MAKQEATTSIVNQCHIFENPSANELAFGCDEGMRTALWDIRDRAEFLRILAGLERNRAGFLIELRTAQFVADGGVAELPLTEFENLMFGAGSGGVLGSYADGFVSSFAVVAPFVACLH